MSDPPHLLSDALQTLEDIRRRINLALGAQEPVREFDLASSEPFNSQLVIMARHELDLRRSRERHFPTVIFGEGAWNILMDLYVQEHLKKDVSVTSACLASNLPATTALRWICFLENEGFLVRENDAADKRRMLVSLTDKGRRNIESYLAFALRKFSTDVGPIFSQVRQIAREA